MKTKIAATAFELVVPVVFIFFAVSSAGPAKIATEQGTVKLNAKKEDIFTKTSLLSYLRQTKSPTIVLRVPQQVDRLLEENRYSKSQIYNTIEKELAKADFIVRDRGLYQKVLDQNLSTDYSKIKELTDTDLILELVASDEEKYYTNKYTNYKGKEKITDGSITISGQKVEFKLIKVKENDLVGSYTFHFTPCTNGCVYNIDHFGTLYNVSTSSKVVKPYEFVSSDRLEEFFKNCAKLLIRELRS